MKKIALLAVIGATFCEILMNLIQFLTILFLRFTFYIFSTMSELDPRIQKWLEKIIELNIKKPHLSEPTMKRILGELGFEDDIDNILLFLCGSFYAQVLQRSKAYHDMARAEDEQGAIKLLSRRMVEIKEAYLETRLDV